MSKNPIAQFGRFSDFLPFLLLRKHSSFGGLQNAVEPTQHREWQDDLAVFGLLVVAAQKVGDRPNEGRKIGISQELNSSKACRFSS